MAKKKSALALKEGVQFQVERIDPRTGKKSWGNVLTKGVADRVTYTHPASGRTESGRLTGNEVFRLVPKKKEEGAPPLALALSA